MSDEKFGSFDDLADVAEENLGPIVRELRRVILEIDPNACEVVRIGDKAATYGLGPKKTSEGYCRILPYKSWVNLGFYQGAHLPDPEALLEGTGENMRHGRIHSLEEINKPEIEPLIRAALSERRDTLSA